MTFDSRGSRSVGAFGAPRRSGMISLASWTPLHSGARRSASFISPLVSLVRIVSLLLCSGWCGGHFRLWNSGGYAHVYKGTEKSTGRDVAIKLLKKFNFRQPGWNETAVLREVSVMKEIAAKECSNLLRLHGAYKMRVNGVSRLGIVLDLMRTDLFERIANSGRYTEKMAAQAFRDAVLGVHALHESNIVHRDLKPENLLLEENSPESPVVVADFGLCEYIDQLKSQYVGTLQYNPPEVVGRTPRFSEKSDIWSLGVVLFIMLSGSPPFFADHRQPKQIHDGQLRQVIAAGRYCFYPSLFDSVSESAKDLIRKMLAVDPAERFTAEDVLQHEWVRCHTEQPDEELSAQQEKIRQFNARRKFKAAALACLWGAHLDECRELSTLVGDTEFTRDQIRAIRDKFRRVSSDGTVNADQFQDVMSELGYDNLPLRRMFELFDANDDGALDFQELVCGLAVLRQGGEEAIRLCFDVMDMDGNGALDQKELQMVLRALSMQLDHEDRVSVEHLQYVFEAMDVNDDGRVTFEEFLDGLRVDPTLVSVFLRPMDRFGGESEATLEAVLSEEPRNE